MKKLLFLCLLMISSISFSQKTDTVQSTIDSTNVVTSTETLQNVEKLVDKYSGKIYELVKELAQNLKVPVEKLLTIIAKQALVEGITYLILGIISIILLYRCYTGINILKYDYKNKNFMFNEETANIRFTINIIGSVLGAILFLSFIININIIVTGFVNPEFRIIEILSETLK